MLTKKMLCFFSAALLTVSVCSCGPSVPEIPEDTRDYRTEIEALKNVEGKENSLDAYAASQNEPLPMEELEGAAEKDREKFFLGVSEACCFIRYGSAESGKARSQFACLTDAGEKDLKNLIPEDRSVIEDAGPVYGSDHYLTMETRYLESEDRSQLFFAERDEKSQKIREIPLEIPEAADTNEMLRTIWYFAMDGSERLHLILSSEKGGSTGSFRRLGNCLQRRL